MDATAAAPPEEIREETVPLSAIKKALEHVANGCTVLYRGRPDHHRSVILLLVDIRSILDPNDFVCIPTSDGVKIRKVSN